jgi:tetratricopeptide (TPR) repeat protein
MKTLILIFLFCSPWMCWAQDATDERMYLAYLSKDSGATPWTDAVEERRQALSKNSKDDQLRYNLALAQFGLLNHTIKVQDEDLFDRYYDQTLDNIDAIITSNKTWSEPYAMKSAIYGLKMGFSPMQGMILGPKSSTLIDKAKKFNEKSPLAWKVYANAKFFTPEMWGGDIEEAIRAYDQCINLYESDPDQLKFNWMYLDALAFQGQAYLKSGQSAKAIAVFEKALRIEPRFDWIRYNLLPKAKSAK